MGKRIRKSFGSAEQVLHLWANQSQDEAYCKNVFFEGDSVWSYGKHYKLGRLHTINGQRVALINSNRYSVTTAKHQSYARSAVAHLPSLSSSDVDCIDTAVLENQDAIVSSLFKFFNQRKFWSGYRLDWEFGQVEKYNAFCLAVGRPKDCIDVPQDFKDLMRDHVKLCLHKQAEALSPEAQAKRAADQEKREARKLAKLQDDIAAWRQGGPLVNSLRDLNPQLIRINGHWVETTRGAIVPYMQAKALLSIVLSLITCI